VPFNWDPTKAAANLEKHGVAFSAVLDFDWQTAFVRADIRVEYGEVRLVALGTVDGVVHSLVFTIRQTSLRVISLRRANRKEAQRYAEEAGSAPD